MIDGRMHGLGWMVLALVAGCVGFAGIAQAEDDLNEVVSAAGKVHYEHYCTPCHGEGGAPGSAKVDLRTYVARNDGNFPTGRWLELLADVEPGNVHSDVWERIREDQAVGASLDSTAARAVIGQIARYVQSIQSK